MRKIYASTACARTEARKIGEAPHPGPVTARQPRTQDLAAVSLFEPATDTLRAKLSSAFENWVTLEIGPGAFSSLCNCPPLLVDVLQCYGYHLFKTGASQFYYRQLLAHYQRMVPGVKPLLQPAWEVCTKWSLLEPAQHRPPMPEALLQAMAGLALGLGWQRFTAVLLIAFYGAARPGEILAARRSDALTPADLLDESVGSCLYVRVRLPKTRRRGARVQHCKLTVQPVVQFVQSVLLALDGRALLFQGSPASFRRRWDFLLQEIGVPRNLRVTPGCLRGGGAVWAYRAGVSLTEICWRMRLANLATLGYYLQEVAADSVLADLPRECLQNVRALREYYRAHLGMQA